MTKQIRGPVWKDRVGGDAGMDTVRFCAGRDVQGRPPADLMLVPYDVWTNAAHAIMLAAQSILTEPELMSLLKALNEIELKAEDGSFEIQPDLEDVHSNIESYLTEKCGAEIAGKIHTGRSRNDQAACTMRLYLRAALLDIVPDMVKLGRALLDQAYQHMSTIMPGFTHRQHGTVSTFAHLLLSHAQAISRDLDRILALFPLVNINPLGAAAGYGTSWPIDRKITTRLLAFEELQDNALDAVGTRWEAEAQVVSLLAFYMNHASTLAADLIFLSTTEAGMIRLADDYVTGSSIMPQKRNPDIAEVVLAKTAFVHGALSTLFSLPRGAISGYNREFQYSKYAAMDALDEVQSVGIQLAGAVRTLVVNAERMAAATTQGYLCAVDLADLLARTRNVPFRTAHGLVAAAIAKAKDESAFTRELFNSEVETAGLQPLSESEWEDATNPVSALAGRIHHGGPAPEAAKRTERTLRHGFQWHADWRESQFERIVIAQRDIANIRRMGLEALKRG